MMEKNEKESKGPELLFLIVDDTMGSEVLRISKKNGITGGTVFYGHGTINNNRLKFFGLDNIRKEIVLMVMDELDAERMMDVFTEKLKLKKPNHGIAFRLPVLNFLGRRHSTYDQNVESREDESSMYKAIFTIVERGQADAVIDAAVAAGSQGGTIINARGSGIHETSKIFGIEIEPEKEIILILADNEKIDSIVASISNELKIEKPGHGILFTMDVSEARGLY